MKKEKRVKYESETSICALCNEQIGTGNLYEWYEYNKETKIGRMKHTIPCNEVKVKCQCKLSTGNDHIVDHCNNNATHEGIVVNKYEKRKLCLECLEAYKKASIKIKEIRELKVKCHFCPEDAVQTNMDGKWVCTSHYHFTGPEYIPKSPKKDVSNLNIHEIAQELKKYISIDDIEKIIETRKKIEEMQLDGILEDVARKKTQVEVAQKDVRTSADKMLKLLDEQKKLIMPEPIIVKILDDEPKMLIGKHKHFPQLLQAIANNVDVFLNGPAGSGKNTAVEQAAKELKRDFHCLQLSQLSLKSELTGYRNIVNDNFLPTTFCKAYENGGIFFADEFDNWAPTVVTSVNMAIANGFYEFPHKTIHRHKDFVFVAAGNTIGLGAEQHYVTSRALSGASRDRFAFIHWPIDEQLEFQMVPEKYAHFVKFVQACRKEVESNGTLMLITPRASIQGSKLLEIGWSKQQVVDSVILRGQEAPTYLNKLIKDFVK